MKKALLFFAFVALTMVVKSQDTVENQTFTFYRTSANSTEQIDASSLNSHYFGQDIAEKLYLVKQNYTFVEAATLTSPGDKTIIRKPAIYNSVKKLEKYYKNAVKDGLISKEEGHDKLAKFLDITILIANQGTTDFESALKKAKKPEQIEHVFSEVVLK
ncbi:MAG: hypothetical protein Q8907_09790 [Bacteroidota bacterium]|nr:hypothetical protein [Bacteroidota bacterium]MDP4226229.1 hypothetical protein [Bacteroidota bacterium]MDP4274556.1 hypothetical protein [Bacteroidota bacterium]